MFDFTNVDLLGYIPKTATEWSGVASAFCHLWGFYLYRKHVLGEQIRPNIATWGMWFFGEVVDLLTYDSMKGSSWATNAGVLACMLGVFSISALIVVLHVRNALRGRRTQYQPVDRSDAYWTLADVSALFLWVFGQGPLGNFVSVGTTVVQYIPTYRETARDPTHEQAGPWAWWCAGYLFNLVAVATGPGSSNLALYFLPVYYFLLDAVVVYLCTRRVRAPWDTRKKWR